MKAKLKARILEVAKNSTFVSPGLEASHMVKLKLSAQHGKVETTLNNAQLAILAGDFYLREVIANQIKIGSTLTITISDEEDDEGSV